MKSTLFPTLEECLFLHETLIKRFGGQTGIRDLGLLESGLARPRSGYYKSLSEQAAALFQSLALNHCFIDGNKRVAFAMTAIFLQMNGWKLSPSPNEGEKFLIQRIIKGKAELDEITHWIEKQMKRVK